MPRGPKGEKHLANIVRNARAGHEGRNWRTRRSIRTENHRAVTIGRLGGKKGGKGNSLISFGGTRAPARGGLAWQNQRDTWNDWTKGLE
jgi:hypothetical protein